MGIDELKEIMEVLKLNSDAYAKPYLAQAYLSLHALYENTRNQLEEANRALQDAVLDDLDSQEIL